MQAKDPSAYQFSIQLSEGSSFIGSTVSSSLYFYFLAQLGLNKLMFLRDTLYMKSVVCKWCCVSLQVSTTTLHLGLHLFLSKFFLSFRKLNARSCTHYNLQVNTDKWHIFKHVAAGTIVCS